MNLLSSRRAAANVCTYEVDMYFRSSRPWQLIMLTWKRITSAGHETYMTEFLNCASLYLDLRQLIF